MIIRTETPMDEEIIAQITRAAFAGKSYSAGTEHLIVNQLRNCGALALSLVAQLDTHVVGHVAFSVVTIDAADISWYGLGPISVQPDRQRQGIGSTLIQAGLARIRELGARGCVVLGSPDYYQRFGFRSYQNFIYEAAPAPQDFMALPWYEEVPEGKVEYHAAFYISNM